MNYENYKRSRDLAWEILLHEGIRELPVKVGELCKGMGINVKYYKTPDSNDGYSIMLDRPMIFIAQDRPTARQRFTAAHELGHILLGHVGKYELVNREPDPKDNPIEQEANVFASRLLAPACVLWALNARTPKEIAELCEISLKAAEFRAERMELLYRRGKFLSSPLERAVHEQFSDFIRGKRRDG